MLDWTVQEMVLCIFRMLPPRDLARVRLVCRHWRDTADCPRLWRRMEVVLGAGQVGGSPPCSAVSRCGGAGYRVAAAGRATDCRPAGAAHLPLQPRPAGAVHTAVQTTPAVQEGEAVFHTILRHAGLREINISQNQISRVEPELLATTVNTMERANLFNAKLTPTQVQALFK